MVLVFLTTSTTFKFLGNNEYGLWVTIYSIISWAYLLDFGFSNVVKTKLPTLLDKSEKEVSTLISTIYIGIIIISLVIIIIAFLLQFFISYSDFLNIDESFSGFNTLLFLNLFFSVLILIIGNYKALYAGAIKTHVVEFSMMLIQLLVFVLLFIFYHFNFLSDTSRIWIVSLVFGVVNLSVGIGFTLFFLYKHPNIKISYKYFDFSILKTNTSLGLKYFIIQICMIIIFSTDYVLITKYFGSKEVANYDVVLKLFQAPMLLVIAGLSPFWSIFSKTFEEKKFHWIKKTLIIYNFLFIIFVIGIVILTLIIDKLIFWWLNEKTDSSKFLLLVISIYIIMRTYTAMYNYFLNGINKINLSLLLTIFGAIINIPICIIFIKLGYGVSGIVIGTCISILPTTIALPIQSFRIINSKL